MKKLFLSLAVAAMAAVSASGATITLFTVQFGSNAGTVSGLVDGSTEVDFAGITYGPLSCSGPDSALCGSASGPIGDTKLTSGNSETFQLGPDLFYNTSSTWSIVISGGTTSILTFGNYYLGSNPGDTTPGRLNFAFPLVDPNGTSNVNAGGVSNPVPEPSSMLFLSSGLIGLGLMARRRRTLRG